MEYNYNEINIPSDKKPKDYHYTERRAEILKIILKAGHPSAVNQSRLCDRYDVNQSSISRDIDRIKKSANIKDKDDIKFITETVYQKSIRELQKKGEYYKSAKVLSMWNDWLFDMGQLDKVPERVQVEETKDLKQAFQEFKELQEDEED